MLRHRGKPEVLLKTDQEIERETSATWFRRAAECYALYQRTKKCQWLARAVSYEQESLEHAALMKDHGKSVKAVQTALAKMKRELKL